MNKWENNATRPCILHFFGQENVIFIREKSGNFDFFVKDRTMLLASENY